MQTNDGPHHRRMGIRLARVSPTIIRRVGDQVSGGPLALEAQSKARIRSAMSPGGAGAPERGAAGSETGSITSYLQAPRDLRRGAGVISDVASVRRRARCGARLPAFPPYQPAPGGVVKGSGRWSGGQ